MPYKYLGDIAVADVAFEATGATLEELFIAAADATMNVMVAELSTIERQEEVRFSVEHPELELLLFNFLNELLFFKDARRLLLRVESVTIVTHPALLTLEAVARGERLDPARHAQLVDVKAVTLHRFRVERTERGWQATVILDI